MFTPVEIVKNKFIEVLGEPTNEVLLERYIKFVHRKNIEIHSTDKYTEYHHIYPVSVFGRNDDVYCLLYKDHMIAHYLLAKAYPIRKFTLPLNYFKVHFNQEDRKSIQEVKSLAAINGWEKLKRNKKKYKEWIDARSKLCSEQMKSGKAKYMADLRYSKNPNARKEVSEHFKGLWENQREMMLEVIRRGQTEETSKKKKIIMKEIWDNRSTEFREDFKSKMSDINKNIEKRKDASNKIKELWNNNKDFQTKMKNRKSKPIGGGSEAMKKRWADPEFKKMMLEKRKQARMRKNKIGDNNETN